MQVWKGAIKLYMKFDVYRADSVTLMRYCRDVWEKYWHSELHMSQRKERGCWISSPEDTAIYWLILTESGTGVNGSNCKQALVQSIAWTNSLLFKVCKNLIELNMKCQEPWRVDWITETKGGSLILSGLLFLCLPLLIVAYWTNYWTNRMNNSVEVAGQWGRFMFNSLLGPVFWLLMSSIWGDGDSYVHPLRGTVITTLSEYSLITRYWSEEESFNSSFLIKM